MGMQFHFGDDEFEYEDGKLKHPVANGSVRIDDAEYLPNILDAFVRFLQMAGFTYVEGLTAHSGGIDHSSTL
jgi:hypothetical protein